MFCSDKLPVDRRKFGVHIVLKVHACWFVIVQADFSWISCVRCDSGWKMVEQIWARYVDRRPLKFGRHWQSSIQVVRVNIPNENKSIHFVFFHSFPLRFELETVIVGMVTECDVPLPCQRVAYLLIRKVIFLSKSHCGVVYECFGELQRRFDPVFRIERILRVSDINAIWMAAKGRWRSRSIGHGRTLQLLTVATKRRLTDGSVFAEITVKSCVKMVTRFGRMPFGKRWRRSESLSRH